jgi:hypothetical protein
MANTAILHICHASNAICSAISPTRISSRFEHGMKPTLVAPRTPAFDVAAGQIKPPESESIKSEKVTVSKVLEQLIRDHMDAGRSREGWTGYGNCG